MEITPESVLRRATELHRRATAADDYAAIWPVLDVARSFGPQAFQAAFALLTSADSSERAVACDLMGNLCNPDEEGFAPEAATALIGLAEHEQDDEVLWSLARALGHARDPRAVSVLAGLVSHPDSGVRFQAAVSLPPCEEGADPEVLGRALMELMEDADERVRDWATFGLGTQTDLDAPDVREALLHRLDDDNCDARDEAIVGLARRRERRVAPVVEGLLQGKQVSRLIVEAAAYLADERLLGPLCALERRWNVDAELLSEALSACDPERRAAAVSCQAEFLELLEAGLRVLPGAVARMSCERLGRDVSVEVERDGDVQWYDFQALVTNRAEGNVRAAVDAVLADTGR